MWDASDNDQSRTLVENFATQNPGIDVRYFKAPRVGLARQRNDAFKESRGDVVFFIDDDSEVSPEGISALAEMFAADESLAGGCLPLDYNFPAGTQPAIMTVTGPLAGLVRAYYGLVEPAKKASGYYPPIPPTSSGKISYLFGCDMAYRKEVLATHPLRRATAKIFELRHLRRPHLFPRTDAGRSQARRIENGLRRSPPRDRGAVQFWIRDGKSRRL